jgi:hypothetical protein
MGSKLTHYRDERSARDHIGIDVPKSGSTMCILANGADVIERRIRPDTRRRFHAALQ